MTEPGLVTWPAAERNKQPILAVLQSLGLRGLVLELASGTGQHAVHFASGLADVIWQPSERDRELLDVIQTRVVASGLDNLRSPLLLDVGLPHWPIPRADTLFCANLLHISPFSVSEALFRGAERLLASGALLVTYGPYKVRGSHTSASNADFDDSLKAQDATWGVRDVDELEPVALRAGLKLVERIQMPANNWTLLWRRD